MFKILAALPRPKSSQCKYNLGNRRSAVFSSATLAFSVASALSLSAMLVNFSIFSAKSSAMSVSFLTIGLEASLL